MRIALLTDGLWPLQIGGMEKHSWYLAKYLAKTGNEVHLFYPFIEKGASMTEPVFGGIQGIIEHAIPVPVRGKFPGHYIRESREVSGLFLKAIRPRLSQFDLVYVQGFAGWELLHAIKAGLNSPPVWVNFHGLEMFQPAPGFKAKLIQFLFRPAVIENLKMADAVISLGGELGTILKRAVRGKVPVIEIPIGVESSWLRADEPVLKTGGPLRFIFIGRNEKRKGTITVKKLTSRYRYFIPQL